MGEPDGSYGQLTRQAVMAFQKVEGLGRDGVAGPVTQERLAVAGRPTPRGSDGLEIDLERQVLFVADGGQVRWAINTSTGNGEAYTSSSGGTAVAATPPGQFEVQREIDGLREAPLGTLYRPKYFNGGIAIHGSGSIPANPRRTAAPGSPTRPWTCCGPAASPRSAPRSGSTEPVRAVRGDRAWSARPRRCCLRSPSRSSVTLRVG